MQNNIMQKVAFIFTFDFDFFFFFVFTGHGWMDTHTHYRNRWTCRRAGRQI